MSDKKNDDFGDRMKMYENIETHKRFIPGLPIYARLDGKSFSKFTKGMNRPFDENMHKCMVEVTKYLVKEYNCNIGFIESDEISLCWYEEDVNSSIIFDYKIQKLLSTLAGTCSSKFMLEAMKYFPDKCERLIPRFDCRIFQLPTLMECANQFVWRNQDATKNAISQAASCYYSHKELMNKTGSEKQEMLFQKGINFNDYPEWFKRGVFIRKQSVEKILSEEELEHIPLQHRPLDNKAIRSEYVVLSTPILSKVENKIGFIFNSEEPIVYSV